VPDIFGPIVIKFVFSRQIFVKVYGIRVHENLSSVCRCNTGGRTDMTKLLWAFATYGERAWK